MVGIFAFAVTTVGCSGSSFVEGTLQLGEISPDNPGFEFAEIRAFPESQDGFDVRRVYSGEEVLEQSLLLGASDVPTAFRLEGYDVGEPGGPWRVLAWLTNRDDSDWVGTSEPMGTRTFTFDCGGGPVCAIRGVDVTIDQVAPSN